MYLWAALWGKYLIQGHFSTQMGKTLPSQPASRLYKKWLYIYTYITLMRLWTKIWRPHTGFKRVGDSFGDMWAKKMTLHFNWELGVCLFQVLGSAGNCSPNIFTRDADGSWDEFPSWLQQHIWTTCLSPPSVVLQHLTRGVSLYTVCLPLLFYVFLHNQQSFSHKPPIIYYNRAFTWKVVFFTLPCSGQFSFQYPNRYFDYLSI